MPVRRPRISETISPVLDSIARDLVPYEDLHWRIMGQERKTPEDVMAIRFLALVEEIGEVARIYNKRALAIRAKETTFNHLLDEWGDALTNMMALMAKSGVMPGEAISHAIRKWAAHTGDDALVKKWLEPLGYSESTQSKSSSPGSHV